eukprot:7930699-Pyramimonas_sp.AAC.1
MDPSSISVLPPAEGGGLEERGSGRCSGLWPYSISTCRTLQVETPRLRYRERLYELNSSCSRSEGGVTPAFFRNSRRVLMASTPHHPQMTSGRSTTSLGPAPVY